MCNKFPYAINCSNYCLNMIKYFAKQTLIKVYIEDSLISKESELEFLVQNLN